MGTPADQTATPDNRVELQPEFLDQIARMRRHLETVRDLDGLERFRETRALPAAFFEHFNTALACYDRLIDFVLSYTGAEQGIHCKKGCCNCCIDLVRGINAPEIINIYRLVRGWPNVKEVFEYHRDSAELFMGMLESRLKPGEQSFGGNDPRVEEAHVEYNRLNRPCGFLDRQTGCCRIYPVRPISCRYFFSADPPETCTPSHPKYLQRDTRTVHLPPAIHELVLQISKRLGFRTLNYLPGAFCGFAAEVMRTNPVQIIPSGEAGGA